MCKIEDLHIYWFIHAFKTSRMAHKFLLALSLPLPLCSPFSLRLNNNDNHNNANIWEILPSHKFFRISCAEMKFYCLFRFSLMSPARRIRWMVFYYIRFNFCRLNPA